MRHAEILTSIIAMCHKGPLAKNSRDQTQILLVSQTSPTNSLILYLIFVLIKYFYLLIMAKSTIKQAKEKTVPVPKQLGLTFGAIPELSLLSHDQKKELKQPIKKSGKKGKVFASDESMLRIVEQVNGSLDVTIRTSIEKENSKLAILAVKEKQKLEKRKHKESLINKAKDSIRNENAPESTSTKKKSSVDPKRKPLKKRDKKVSFAADE
jgi:hypothetical protein